MPKERGPVLRTFATLENGSDVRTHAGGDIVFAEGKASNGFMYVLLSGSVRIVKGQRLIETVDVGGVFGELALIDELPRSASAIAVAESKVAAISSERFREMILRNPSFALDVMRLLTRRIRQNLNA
jgi:CRP/FNR family transcriptional regulator, cyclic AMP receptor protein